MGVLIYDGDCGFCQRCLTAARRLGARDDAAPWQSLDLSRYGLTEAQVSEAAWYVTHTGDDAAEHLLRGHLAVAAFLRSSGSRWVRLLGRALASRWVAPLAAPAYAWVARHRDALPGGTPACRLG